MRPFGQHQTSTPGRPDTVGAPADRRAGPAGQPAPAQQSGHPTAPAGWRKVTGTRKERLPRTTQQRIAEDRGFLPARAPQVIDAMQKRCGHATRRGWTTGCSNTAHSQTASGVNSPNYAGGRSGANAGTRHDAARTMDMLEEPRKTARGATASLHFTQAQARPLEPAHGSGRPTLVPDPGCPNGTTSDHFGMELRKRQGRKAGKGKG